MEEMGKGQIALIDACLSKISLIVLDALFKQLEEPPSTGSEIVHIDFNIRKRTIDEVADCTRTKRIKLLDQRTSNVAATNSVITSPVDGDIASRGRTAIDSGLALKLYIACLPAHLWTKLMRIVLGGIQRDAAATKKCGLQLLAKRFCEVLFSLKVNRFSTGWIAEGVWREVEHIICEKLFLCRRLQLLEITTKLDQTRSQKMFYCSLLSMKHIRTLVLLPDELYSFHWILPIFEKEFPALDELRIVYDNSWDTSNIRSLAGCARLTKLYLYSYGSKIEAPSIIFLLTHLKNVKVLFHKEIPNALLQYREVHYGAELNLQHLILFDWTKGIGMQTIYIPNEFLEQICQLCPKLTHLSLMNPTCLNKVAHLLPQLESLSVQQGDFIEIIGKAVVSNSFGNLRSLELQYLACISYADILSLAKHCTILQHLKIIGCNVIASGEFSLHVTRSACFRNLITLTVIRNSATRNAFEANQWHVGRRITEFLLKNATRLEYVELEFGYHPYVNNFNWNNFEELFGHCIHLKELYLMAPPVISYDIVTTIVTNCSRLTSFGRHDTWSLAMEEKNKILQSFGRIIV